VRDRGFSPAHRSEREKAAGKHPENITQNNAAGYTERQHSRSAITLTQALQRKADDFTRLQRRIDSSHRNYCDALQELRRLQAEGAGQNPGPAIARGETAKPQNGCVPQTGRHSDFTDPHGRLLTSEATTLTETVRKRAGVTIRPISRIKVTAL
jgi:hypothetical protein